MHDIMTNRHFRLVLQLCGTILLAIGLICIAGWAFGNQVLNRFSPQYVPMALDTAGAFVMFGVLFLTYSSPIAIRVPLGARYALMGIIGVYGLLKAIEFPLGKDLTFTAVLFPAKEYLGQYVIGRMSPVTGAVLFVSAIAALSLLIGTRRQRLLAGWIGIMVSCTGFLATYAYALGAPFLYGDGIQPLAAPTAAAFCFLGIGLVVAAGPGAVLKPFVGVSTKSRTLRLLVPLVVLTCFAQEILHHLVTEDGELPRVVIILLVPLTAALTATLAGERLVRYLARRLSESEHRLTESEEKFREFFHNAQVGMFRTVMDGSRLLEANDKFLEILGRTRDEAADLPPTTYWADLSERDELIRRLRAEGAVSNFECRLLRKDGDIRNCIASARIYLPQKIVEGSVLDITERQRSESALRRQNEYQAALQKTTLDLLAEHDLDRLLEGILTRAGELVGTATGWLDVLEPGTDRLTPKFALGVLSTESRRFAVQKGEGISGKVWETGQPMVVEDYDAWAGRIPDHGQNIIRSILAVPLFSHSEVIGVLGLAYERSIVRSFDDADINVIAQLSRMAGLAIENARLITAARQELAERLQAEEEQEKLERQLRQAQKLETIGTLAGGVAHDFNNILTPILVYSEMAAKHLGSEHPTRADLEHVITGANRAKDLVKQILTFSRQSENETILIELAPIVKEALKLLRASLPSTIAIEDHIQAGCGNVLADPSQIHQVLMNLCTNAYHAMRDHGGILKVSLESCQVSETIPIGIPPLAAGEYVRITVSDTGCGMDTHTLERIFEPFYTTKKVGEGTGLGLSVVHGIVKSHNGTITVQSDVGIGTAFDVYLPRVQSSREKHVREEVPVVGGNERILIVDDEPEVAEVLKDVLEELFGYSVTVRTNSLDALAFLRRQPNRFDLVIADLTMPHLTGDQLAREVGTIRKDLPVILMTGFSEEFNDERCRQLGIAGFLLKPPLSSELARKVRHVLDSVQSSPVGE